ncbi:MAG TPA: peptidylprolyl isomerase [Candidatus Binataceae bacterium]|nr:peptidylprolyl isomerase [Candidatus Binataceae bacterium]
MKPKLFTLTSLAALFAILAIAPACRAADSDGLPVRNTGHYAIIDSDRGIIVIELYPKVAPKTVENFEKLVNKGFYNGLTFHRVEPGFVVQGGDPNGNGTGGPGYTVPAEISSTEHHLRGTVATARTGDEVNPTRASSGSQFYICLAPAPFLDNNYTIYGGVIKGMDVVDQIKVGDHMKKVTLAKEPPK